MDKALWNQVQPLLDKAIDMPAGERTAWLMRLREESPTIADELQRLLAREGTLDRRGFLDTPTSLDSLVGRMVDGSTATYQRAELERALAPGYELQAEVGRGGMATVFRARDTRHGRDVAIKVIRPDAASVLGAERFLAEIRLTANLTHPNILPLLDSGQAGGALFYVMPFIEGETLRARMRREGALPVEDVRRLLRSVLEALAHAHEKGLVHRDIKPDNVLLAGRQAWVADFGIAKAIASSGTSVHAATSVGVALGSPGYMAPEQIEGSAAIDARTDLYAVGAMAWEMLAGRPVFTGESMQQLFMRHLTAVPESLQAVRPDVPTALADAVMRCLAKAPNDRWLTAAALLEELDQVTSGAAPRAPVRRVGRGRRWQLPALLGVLGVAATGWWWIGRTPAFAPSAPERITNAGTVSQPRLSPDGSQLAFRRDGGELWIQTMPQGTARRVGRAAPGFLSWLDDSTLVTYRPGEPPTFMATADGSSSQPDWVTSRGGQWYQPSPGPLLNLRRGITPADTLTVTIAEVRRGGFGDSVRVSLDAGERVVWLAGGVAEGLLVLASRLPDSTVRISRLDATGDRVVVFATTPADTSGAFASLSRTAYFGPTRRFLYAPMRRDSIFRLDLDASPPRGERLALDLPGVPQDMGRNGDLIVPRIENISRTWRFPIPIDSAKTARMIAQTTGAVNVVPALSPDGAVLAQVEALPALRSSSLYLQDTAGGNRRLLTTQPGTLMAAQWSPDGTRLVTRHVPPGRGAEWIVVDVRSSEVTRLGKPSQPRGSNVISFGFPAAWSPDGRYVYAPDFDVNPRGRLRRYAVTASDTGEVVSRFWEQHEGYLPEGIVPSPDGRQLVVGGASLVVVALPSGPAREIVPTDSVTLVIPISWDADGNILYALRDSRVRGNAMRELAMVSARGGKPRPLGAIPAPCGIHIGVLRNGREATCVEQEQVIDAYRIRGLR
ncbi:MAG: serine/threonine-protein kinase [Gemmatimonadetes bacterium]|nr:serine/threonine-protein kinase [Gemmatimonadota bacterium]